MVAMLHILIQETHGQYFGHSNGMTFGRMGKRGYIKPKQHRAPYKQSNNYKRDDDDAVAARLESDLDSILDEEIEPRVSRHGAGQEARLAGLLRNSYFINKLLANDNFESGENNADDENDDDEGSNIHKRHRERF
jgi:hypothetical protein